MRVAILCSYLFAIGSAAQVTWYVDDNAPGDPLPGDTTASDPLEDGSAAHPFDAIQEAVAAATAGDTVQLADGTYTGDGNCDIDLLGKNITLRSENGPAHCVIDVEQVRAKRGLYIANGETAACVIEGLTIRGGFAFVGSTFLASSVGESRGGAIYVSGASPTIRDCWFEENKTSSYEDPFEADGDPDESKGGAIFLNDASSVIVDCTFVNNTTDALVEELFSTLYAAEVSGGAIFAQDSTPTIRRCVFRANQGLGGGAGNPDRAGGAVTLLDCTTVLEDCIFSENRIADGTNGGTIQNSRATDGGHGGALGVYLGTATITRCSFDNNAAGDGIGLDFGGSDGGDGGAIYLYGAQATITACQFADNQSGRGGDSFFLNELAGDGGRGGAIACVDTNLTVRHTLLARNQAGARGTRSDGNGMSNNGPGGGIAALGTATVAIINATITDNTLPLGRPTDPDLGGGVYAADTASTTITNSILRNNTPGNYQTADSGTLSATYTNVPGLPGTGNIDANPGFPPAGGIDGDPTTIDDNYRPGWGASGNDAGDNTALLPGSPVDLDGGPRRTDDPDAPDTGNGSMPLVDLGAFEANNGAPFCDMVNIPDCDNDGVPDDCSDDCDLDGAPDACQIAIDPTVDCDQNGVVDSCEMSADDCNGNSILDRCEIAADPTLDCDANGVLDSCEILTDDCDNNGVLDRCEGDCNNNGIADPCELFGPFVGNALAYSAQDALPLSAPGSAYQIPSGSVAIEAWIYPTQMVGTQTIVRERNHNYWLRTFNGQVTFSFAGPTRNYRYTTDAIPELNQWSHVAVVYEFGTETIRLRLNGTDVSGTWNFVPFELPTPTPAAPLDLGNNGSTQTAGWNGLLDEIRVWDVPRTPQEIDFFARRDVTGATGLRALIRFDAPGTAVTELVQNVTTSLPAGASLVEVSDCCKLLAGEPDCDNDGLSDSCVDDSDGDLIPDSCDCNGDVDANGMTDLSDLAELLANFGDNCGACPADLDGSGTIDLSDLAILLAEFGCTVP